MREKLLAIALICLFLVSGCNFGKPYIVKIGPDTVGVEEFRFYFLLSQRAYEQEGGTDIWETSINGIKAEEIAKERALESLSVVKISCRQADSLNIKLEAEDRQKASEMAINYKTILGDEDLAEIAITDDQLQKIMEETILYRKVFDETTKNVEVSENDFNVYFDEYVKENDVDTSDSGEIEALKQTVYTMYEGSIKSDVFDEQFSKWSEGVKIEKNPELWDSVKILPH